MDYGTFGSSETQLTIPATRVIPPTPAGLQDHVMKTGTVMDEAAEADSGHLDSAVKGRKHDTTNATLQQGFLKLECVISEISRSTSLPSQQIISLWNKSNTLNFKQEISRLGDEAPEAPGTPSTNLRLKCYDAFKEAFPDTWQNILELHEEAALFLGVPQTVAARAQEFHKFGKRLSAMMDAGAARYGYEAALVACGKVINQDGSLGMAHTTPGAAGFWMSRCKADEDTIIGHLKAQVYNLASLAIVEEAFEDEIIPVKNDEREVSTALSDPLDCFSDPLDISKDGIKWVKAEISRQIKKLNGKLLSEKNFPWKTLPGELTCLGMVIKGYPEDVLLPGGFHTTVNKGIANLTLKETGIMIAVLRARTMCIKKVSDDTQAKLVTSDIPVLEDRQGAPRQKPSMAIKGKGKGKGKGKVSTRQTSHHPTISLSDNESAEELDTIAPPARPIGPPPPSREFKVVKLPTSQKKVEKKVPKKVSNKEVISLLSSDGRSGSECPEEDGASNGHSDYEDESSSKKRKARSDGTSQASKKRPSPSDATTEKADLPKSVKSKGKGKGSAERRGSPVIAESSDEETVPEQGRAKCLRDGPSSKPVVLIQERPKSRPVVKKPLAGDTNSPNDSAVKGGATEGSCKPAEVLTTLTTNADSVPVHANPAPPTLSAKPQSASVQPLTTEVPPTLPTAEVPPTLAAHHGRHPEADGMVISQDGDPNEHRLMVQPHDANLRPGNFQADPWMYAPRQRLPMQPRYPSP
ncbi:hypothetical protein EDD22DRAFT_963314, partial [Suillus occidentalis]